MHLVAGFEEVVRDIVAVVAVGSVAEGQRSDDSSVESHLDVELGNETVMQIKH